MLTKALRIFILISYACSSMQAALPITVTAEPTQQAISQPTESLNISYPPTEVTAPPLTVTVEPPQQVTSNRATTKPLGTPYIRIKDLAHFSSVRDNPLVGYGLVVGLNGTGDTMSRSTFTRESLTGMLERLGVNIRDGAVPSGKNVAAVMVTATLPAFAQPGTRLDISVSALGDAKELRGGTLLVTPLLGADGNVYAVGQGSVLAAGIQVSGKASKEVRGVPTCARVVNGAIVERAMGFQLASLKELNLTLRNPDFTTSQRISEALNKRFSNTATATDAANVRIQIPAAYANNLVGFMTEIEQITVQPDTTARVIIDANNDVVTLTSTAKIMPVALTHGSITIKVIETPQVYMPQPNTSNSNANSINQNINVMNATTNNNQKETANNLIATLITQQSKEREELSKAQAEARKNETDTDKRAQLESEQQDQMESLQKNHNEALNQLIASANNRETSSDTQHAGSNLQTNGSGPVIVDKTDVQLKEETGKFAVIQSGADLQEFVNALNALGTTPKDMMAILQNIKAAGALQADIVMA